MRARTLYLAVTVVAVVSAAGLTQAQVARRGAPGPIRMAGAVEAQLVERNAEQLGVDADTLAAVKAAGEAGRAAASVHVEALGKARERLEKLLQSELPDEKALVAAADSMGQAWTQNLQERMRTSVKIRMLLTAEQRVKLAALRAQPKRRPQAGLGAPMGPAPGMVNGRGAP
jgi:Spy/CpxP family protein refolding chaperone